MTKSIVSITELLPVIQDKLNAGGIVSLTVKGTSMRPFLCSDETIVNLIKNNEVIRPYDIVLYINNDLTIILHRVVKIKADKLIICGDALKINETINMNQVIAVAKSFSLNGKTTDVIDKSYLRKVKLWVFLKPFRRILLGIIYRIWRR